MSVAIDSLQVGFEFQNIEHFQKGRIPAIEAFQVFEIQKMFEEFEIALTPACKWFKLSCKRWNEQWQGRKQKWAIKIFLIQMGF